MSWRVMLLGAQQPGQRPPMSTICQAYGIIVPSKETSICKLHTVAQVSSCALMTVHGTQACWLMAFALHATGLGWAALRNQHEHREVGFAKLRFWWPCVATSEAISSMCTDRSPPPFCPIPMDYVHPGIPCRYSPALIAQFSDDPLGLLLV